MPRQETGKRRLHLASGCIVWSDEEREAGICFDELPAETLGQIRDYVAQQSGLDLVDLPSTRSVVADETPAAG